MSEIKSKSSKLILFRRIFQSVGIIISLIGAFGIAMTHVIFPAIHCYSCPWSAWICPVGIAQHFVAGSTIPLYFLGFLAFYGVLLGRAWCGWVCPFGTFNDLWSGFGLRKRKPNALKPSFAKRWGMIFVILFGLAWLIAGLSFKSSSGISNVFSDTFDINARWQLISAVVIVTAGSALLFAKNLQSLVKYLILAVTLLLAWLTADVMFCKICAVGTLEASIPYFFISDYPILAPFYLHIYTLLITIAGIILVARFWCRYICPMGAMLGLFNRISALQLRHTSENCGHCGAECVKSCPMGIKDIPKHDLVGSSDCIRCGECVTACPHDCLYFNKNKKSNKES